MRIRSTERPPIGDDLDRIVREGASSDDRQHFSRLLRRLQKAFFLDTQYRPLPPRTRLVEQYKKNGLVLFLGAGVSRASGIPSWLELADALLLKSGIAAEELEAVKRALPSQIAQFELAGQLLGSNRGLVTAIYEALYDRMECKSQLKRIPRIYEEQMGWHGWTDVLTSLQANKALEAVGNLLIGDTSAGPRRNPQIHAVLTSNVDNLLELYCEAKTGGRRIITMVDRASVGEHPDQTPVYHLHGTLDARDENVFRSAPASMPPDEVQQLTDDLLPDLVFRESEYYETIANPVSFVNHTPQSFLRGLNTLFIGTSLDDMNIRRWLHDSFRERVLHRFNYLREFYWRPYLHAKQEAKLESLRHFWLRPEAEKDKDGKTFLVSKRHVESVMKNLGVQLVWCTDYDDMWRCIHDVQELGADPEFGRRVADYPN
jgi:SIR2-like domain